MNSYSRWIFPLAALLLIYASIDPIRSLTSEKAPWPTIEPRLWDSNFQDQLAFDPVEATKAMEMARAGREEKDASAARFRSRGELASWASAIFMALITLVAGVHGKILSAASLDRETQKFLDDINESKKLNAIMGTLAALAIIANTLGAKAMTSATELQRRADDIQVNISKLRTDLDAPQLSHAKAQEIIDELQRLKHK